MTPPSRVRNPHQTIHIPAETWTAIRIAALQLKYPSTSALVEAILADWLRGQPKEGA